MTKLRIKDIAQKAHVSIGTVDRVIHERGEVSEKTKELVLAIIQEEGYEPNLLARRLASKKSYTIATLLPSFQTDNDYWNYPQLGIAKAAKELQDYGIEIQQFSFDQFNQSTFNQAMKDICECNPDGMVISPVFPNDCRFLIDYCGEKDIPFVFIDSDIPGVNRLSFVGQNAFDSGMLAGRLMSYGIAPNSTVLIVCIVSLQVNTTHTFARGRGFSSSFASNSLYSSVNLVQMDIDENTDEKIAMAMSNAFRQNKNIQGIFVTNSKAHRIASFLESNRILGIKVIGYDLVRDNIHFLENGRIDFLISQKPEAQGYDAIMSLFNKLVLKKSVDDIKYAPMDIITKENIKYYLNL
jgi:LacI family transcriptional regulator